ncbi:glycoside hydrolase family 88/105 protein [Enterococcus asini]|uniref:glycoside hydrolase family 88/105 protein n=1 Tax=Enterococcus asini TaxID=57732 RepID=UPI000E5378C7|nr:glycoside hydrolase family 88 protein [Enterococcus asini]RGW12364.1 glycoside hydrolase family 105 protein [Enterococcus asini]
MLEIVEVQSKTVQKALDKVVNQLISLDQVDGKEFEALSVKEQQKIGFFSRDFGMKHWDWPQGIGLFGLSQFGSKYDSYIKSWAEEELSKGLPLPNINTICPLLTLMDYPEYEELCLKWVDEIISNFDRTKKNGFQHNTTGLTKDSLTKNPEQLWADTVFMTVLFLTKMGRKYQNQTWLDEATYQVLLHTTYLFDRSEGLFYHGWDFNSNDNVGNIFWCRGNSWLTMGIPIFIDYMGDLLAVGVRQYLIEIYKSQVESLVKIQDNSGLWHTILDDSKSYLETSGSAGIIAGIYYGMSNGYLEKAIYQPICEKSISSLIKKIDTDGTVLNVSAGTCISRNKNDYKNIIIKPMAYGQALMICALGQALLYGEGE